MSRAVMAILPSCMSLGWTKRMSSISFSSFSSTAQTRPSKSLRVTRRNFSWLMKVSRLGAWVGMAAFDDRHCRRAGKIKHAAIVTTLTRRPPFVLLSLATPHRIGPTWPRRPVATSALSRCLWLAVLLHLLLVLLLGNTPGGTARPGDGVWGRLSVRLAGPPGPAPDGPAIG